MTIHQYRKQVQKTCECGCGKTFVGLKTRKYYNNACRQRAKYARKKLLKMTR